MSSTLYVGNLDWNVDSSQLKEFFENQGSVVSARVITDRETQRSRGFGFVQMASPEEAQSAMTSLDGTSFHQRSLRVNIAEDRRNGNRQ